MVALITFLFFTLGFALVGFWIFALIEIIQRPFYNDTEKVVWLLLVLAVPFLGTILYFSLGRKQLQLDYQTVDYIEDELV